MADLFGDSGGSGDEDAGASTPAEAPTTNGHSELEDPAPEEAKSSEDDAEAPESQENGLEGEAKDDAEENTARGPRDDIKVSVLRYQKTADDFTFDVEV